MSEAIITVENLGKEYLLRHLRDQRYVALRDVLVEKATSLFSRNGHVRDRKSLASDLGSMPATLKPGEGGTSDQKASSQFSIP